MTSPSTGRFDEINTSPVHQNKQIPLETQSSESYRFSIGQMDHQTYFKESKKRDMNAAYQMYYTSVFDDAYESLDRRVKFLEETLGNSEREPTSSHNHHTFKDIYKPMGGGYYEDHSKRVTMIRQKQILQEDDALAYFLAYGDPRVFFSESLKSFQDVETN